MNRIELLDDTYAGRTRLEAALVRLTPEQMTSLDLGGGWSVKDLLAHLGWWEARCVEIYHALSSGKAPETPVTEETIDVTNAEVIESFRPRDLEEVRAYEQAAYRRLVTLIETAPEADLFDPQRFAWTNGQAFYRWVVGNASGHYAEHLEVLERRLAEVGAASAPPTPEAPHAVSGQAAQPAPDPLVRRGRDFLEREGRDIERAVFDCVFGAQPVDRALEVLAGYQNPDGGFTRLEVDIQSPVSNPFATELALNLLVALDPPRDHPLVRAVVAYLEDTQDEEGSWRFTPEVYQQSLAPWFQGWQWPNLNPSATTAGFLKQLGLGSDRLHARVQALFKRLATPADLLVNDFYAARPYALYLQTEWDFPQADFYRWGIVWWLVRQALTNAEIDAMHWMEYASRPESAVARRLPPQMLQGQLDRLKKSVSDDGGWPTPYNAAWRPWVTLQALLTLRAYGAV